MGLTIKTPGAVVGAASPYDKHLTSTPAKGQVKITKITTTGPGQPKVETSIMDETEVVHPGILTPKEKLCMLEVAGGSTVSLGNYEFARIDVKLSMPCTKESIDETFEFISTWVGEKIETAIKNSKE